MDPCPELETGAPVTLKSLRRSRDLVLAGQRLVNGLWLIKLAGVDTIGQALPLVGCELLSASVPEAAAPAGPLGYEVLDSAGLSWGRVTGVRRKPAPLLEVQPPAGGEPLLVPFHEPIVVSVDDRRRLVRIDPPAGLKELNG